VFGAKNRVNMNDTRSADYCHPTLYQFAFWILIITYILMVVSCCISCFRACFKSVSTLKA